MKYYKCDRFIKIQAVENNKVKDVPSDWVEVQKNGEPLKEVAKEEPKKPEKMADPGKLPMPTVPIPSPRTIYQDPEALQEFHFGPPPVKGAMVDSGAAKSAAWGAAIPSILNSGLKTYNMFQ